MTPSRDCICQAPGRLQVRIGITSGMVVIASGERNAVGETINLAARLQTIAKPGSVVVSESVRRMAGGEFEYEDLGEKELKGVSGLTKIYRVLGVSRAESRFEAATQRRLTPIVGRDTEISALLDNWRQVLGDTDVGGRSCCAEKPASERAGRPVHCASVYGTTAVDPICFNVRRSSSTVPFIRSERISNVR